MLPEARNRREQRAGVGMLRRRENLAHRRFLHLLTLPHHHHVVGHFGNHAHVMGNEDDGSAHLLLQIANDVQDLRLDRHVERSGRLVGDQELGIAGERHGDHDALAHPARELMRVAVEQLFRVRQAHLLQKRFCPCESVARVQSLVKRQCFGDLVTDREDRVQRCHRLLKDHRDIVAADRPELVGPTP